MIQNKFVITSYAWHEVANKLIDTEIEDLLGNHLQLSDYSDEVKEYLVRAIALEDVGFPPKHFSIKTGILHNFYVLEVPLLMEMDIKKAYQYQAEKYLESILEIPMIRGMKKRTFKTQLFYDDVKLLFQKEKLITNF